jgi:hypothetical protein
VVSMVSDLGTKKKRHEVYPRKVLRQASICGKSAGEKTETELTTDFGCDIDHGIDDQWILSIR